MGRIIKISIIFLVLIAGFSFGFKTTKAALPVKAGLGQACNASILCDERFSCSGGKCVQCEDDYGCSKPLGESCVNNVCTLPNGNNISDLCAKNDNCKSGLICGARSTCEESGGGSGQHTYYICDKTSGTKVGGPYSSGEECNKNIGRSTVCVIELPSATQDEISQDCQNVAKSAGTGTSGGEDNWMGIDLTIQDVADIINGLACWLTRIATAIMVIFLILAGLRFMNARGNPTTYQAAVKNFQQVLIGILVIMAVYVIIATVANAVGLTDFSLIPLVC